MNHRSSYEPDDHGSPSASAQIRAATCADAAGIGIIDAEWIERPVQEITEKIRLHLRRIASCRKPLEHICVALDGDKIVGYGKCAWIDWSEKGISDLPSAWYLTGITVARAWRRQGIGTKIVEYRLGWLRGRAEEVYFFTGQPNRVSQDLHARFDFTEVGLKFKSPSGNLPDESNILYKKTLASTAC